MTNIEKRTAMISLDELAANIYPGEYGDALNDYRDSSAYICDAISEAADNNVSIYYCDILSFVSEHPEALNDVVAEGLYCPSSRSYDFWDHARSAQYMVIERDIYANLADSLMIAAIDFIRYDLGRCEITEELAELLREWCDNADSCDRMSDIPDSIREYLEEIEEEEEEEEEEED